MAHTDARTRRTDHGSEEDWVDFAHGQVEPGKRARLEQHLETGCSRCSRTLRLWRAVLDVADEEGRYNPPEGTLRQLAGQFALRRPRPLLGRVAERAALLFDSFRQPLPAGVRAVGPAPRQLLVMVGRYTIRLRLEPSADAERFSIVGQILDEQDPPTVLQDIAVSALKGGKTLDRTLTNQLGEFVLEPETTETLQLCVGLAQIGTFTVPAPRQSHAAHVVADDPPRRGAARIAGKGRGSARAAEKLRQLKGRARQ
jgi:hypothetical protein